MTALRPWVEKNLGIDLANTTRSIERNAVKIPPPQRNPLFCAFLRANGISFSNHPQIRLIRSHGQTLSEIIAIRQGQIGRIPDIVVWPRDEEQIQKVYLGEGKLKV